MKPEERPTIETILEHAALKELPLPPAPVEEDKPKSEWMILGILLTLMEFQ